MKRRGITKNKENYNYNRSFKPNSGVCGIINIGNNCYLNSGLQILASCELLVNELERNGSNDHYNNNKIVTLLNNAFDTLLNKGIYDPEVFMDHFCKINYDFIKGSQSCSQNFIRTVIRNINDCLKKTCIGSSQYNPSNYNEKLEYNKFIKSSNIFPESKIMSLFSGMTKCHSYGRCPRCGEKIDNYSFSYFIDQNMYLDEFEYKCKFSDVLKANIGNDNKLTMDCPKCHKEIEVKDETKYIKLPDILIFTLERYQGPTNKVSIVPNEILDMKDYIENPLNVDCTIYELFAINIRFGSTANFGHEICQVKRKGKWYQINDSYGYEIESPSNFDSSYGLFYIKKTKEKYNFQTYKNKDINLYKIGDDIYNNKQITNDRISPKIDSDNNNNIDCLNCALQIISSCKELKNVLKIYSNIPENWISGRISNIINNILNGIEPNLDEALNYFNKKILDFKENENDVQNIIRKLIIAMNKEFLNSNVKKIEENIDYKDNKNKEFINYIKNNNIYPQSKVYSIFSQMTRHSFNSDYCNKCFKELKNNDSYDNNIDLFLYLPPSKKNNIKRTYLFSQILKLNIESQKMQIKCRACGSKNEIKEKITFIKLPKILIFTLNRFKKENNKIENKLEIIPDNEIDMEIYKDPNYKVEFSKAKYKLFAANIMREKDNGCLDYICQVEREEGKWYEIDNNKKTPIKNPSIDGSNSEYFCGLFYKSV